MVRFYPTSLDVIPTKILVFCWDNPWIKSKGWSLFRSLKTPLKCTDHCFFERSSSETSTLLSYCSILQKDTIKKIWNSLGNSFFYANFDEFGTSVAFSGHHRIDSKSSVFPWYFLWILVSLEVWCCRASSWRSLYSWSSRRPIFLSPVTVQTFESLEIFEHFWTKIVDVWILLRIFEDDFRFLWNLSIFDCCYSWILLLL